MATSTGGSKPQPKQGIPKSAEPEKTTVEKLADIAGVGKGTIQNTETILNKGTKEDIQSFTKLLVSGGKSE